MILSTKASEAPLTGTEPQIKWAKQVRKKKLADLKKMTVKELALGMKPHLSEEALQAIKCTTPERVGQLVWFVAYAMFEETNAAWWVITRDEPIWKWIGPATEKVVQRCKDQNTFK